jgi:hypothetical protein
LSYTSNADLADLFRPEPLDLTAYRIVERVGDDLNQRVRRHTPVATPPPGAAAEWLAARHRRPGHARDSWKVGEVTVILGGERYSIDVYTLDPVMPHIEWDTQPHLIVPKDPNGVLRYWNRVGDRVFAKVVHHPGTRGKHMMATSLVEVAASWQRIGHEELRRWSREQVAGIR